MSERQVLPVAHFESRGNRLTAALMAVGDEFPQALDREPFQLHWPCRVALAALAAASDLAVLVEVQFIFEQGQQNMRIVCLA
jgi:hypothetical protein